MKNSRWLALAFVALMAAAVFAPSIVGAQATPVIGPSTYTFTAGSQSNVWACNTGQSTFALTVPSGLTGTFTVTVAQTSSGTYINPPNAFAPGSTTYTNTITNSGSLTVALGANAYVKVADTSYTSGSVTVSGVCSGSSPSGPSAASVIPTPIPWTTASPAPVSCVAVAAVGTCATPIPWSQASPLPISLPTSFPGNFPTPIPYPTSSIMPGTLRSVRVGPSTAPAASNGGYDAVVDSNGRTATRVCDATTSTQCVAVTAGGVVSTHDSAPVQPSPLYTTPVSMTLSTPLPVATASANPLPTASAGAAPPGNAPHVVAWMACVTSAGSAPVTTGGNGQAAICPNGILQVTTSNSSATKVCDSTTPTNCAKVVNGAQVSGTTSGNSSILTSASATACTSVTTSGAPSIVLDNTGAQMTVFLQLYDEGATPTCAASDLIYGDGTSIVLGPGQVVVLYQGVKNGLAYKLSGALTSNLVIGW